MTRPPRSDLAPRFDVGVAHRRSFLTWQWSVTKSHPGTNSISSEITGNCATRRRAQHMAEHVRDEWERETWRQEHRRRHSDLLDNAWQELA